MLRCSEKKKKKKLEKFQTSAAGLCNNHFSIYSQNYCMQFHQKRLHHKSFPQHFSIPSDKLFFKTYVDSWFLNLIDLWPTHHIETNQLTCNSTKWFLPWEHYPYKFISCYCFLPISPENIRKALFFYF